MIENKLEKKDTKVTYARIFYISQSSVLKYPKAKCFITDFGFGFIIYTDLTCAKQ